MKVYAYGEDALTLWAIQNRLSTLLDTLGDHTSPSDCQVFFRPSFGRRGGSNSSQFGEFDFIVLADRHLYLGETKWDGSSERIQDGRLLLRPEQTLRHKVFRFYVEDWAFGPQRSWAEFGRTCQGRLRELADKPIPSAPSRLARSLQFVLGVIRRHFASLPIMQDVLLYMYDAAVLHDLPSEASEDFMVIAVDYSEASDDGFVTIAL